MKVSNGAHEVRHVVTFGKDAYTRDYRVLCHEVHFIFLPPSLHHPSSLHPPSLLLFFLLILHFVLFLFPFILCLIDGPCLRIGRPLCLWAALSTGQVGPCPILLSSFSLPS